MVQGQAFKGRQFAAEVILWAVRWYLMFPISYRDLALMLQDRGVSVGPHDHFPLDPSLCGRAGEADPAASAADQRLVAGGREYAAASGVRDGGWLPAIGLQEQVANHRKRRGSKARVVSVTEKASQGIRWETGRRTQVNCRSSVENCEMTSKPAGFVTPGSVWTRPAYGPDGVRHRGSAILFRALTLNCGNLRRRWQAKGASSQGEAESERCAAKGRSRS